MIADTLYGKYIAEREGLSILEDKHGFITFKISGEECFIADMYVEKGQRKSGHGRRLIEALEDVAKTCIVMTANIWPHKPGSSEALLGALKVGFKVKRADAGVLLIAKDLLEDNNGK